MVVCVHVDPTPQDAIGTSPSDTADPTTTAPDTIITEAGPLSTGDVFGVWGERGRFTMRGLNRDGSIAAWGGRIGYEKHRDFRSTHVRRLHRPKKARPE